VFSCLVQMAAYSLFKFLTLLMRNPYIELVKIYGFIYQKHLFDLLVFNYYFVW
jgi:hypothetical protein